MKKITSFSIMLFAFILFSLSAASAQSSAMLLTTPTQVNLSTEIGLNAQQVVTVKIAGIPGLSVASSFDLSIEGADADQFSVIDPNPSLGSLISELLGQGHEIYVYYNPTKKGPHQATLLIEASLLGLIMPVQTTIPLTGNTQIPQGPPSVIFTDPVDDTPDIQADEAIFSVTYNQDITVTDESLITINGQSAINVSAEDNVLTIDNISQDSPFLESGITYNVVIGAGAIKGENNYSTVQNYTFSFSTNDYPVVTSSNPAIGSTITATADPDQYIPITFNFDRNITQGYQGSIISMNESFNIQNITFGTNTVTIELNNQAAIGVSQVDILFEKGSVLDANSNQAFGTYTYYIDYNQTRNATDVNDIADSNKTIMDESYYSISGIRLSKDNLQPGAFYIKRVIYEDGSVDTVKFFEPLRR